MRGARISGYTLIEFAVVLMVAGIAMAGASGAYNIYLKQQNMDVTKAHTAIVTNAISNYMSETGRYPCPAAIDADPSSLAYGEVTDCSDETVAVGTCSGGICIEESERQVNVAPIGDPEIMGYPRVRRGGIPFRTLNLPETYAYDGYQTRLEYAVTERLAVTETFDKNDGGLSIVDGQTPGVSLVRPDSSAHYLVFSHGPDRVGAYNKYGKQATPCTGAGLDLENCDTATDNKATYRQMQIAFNSGANKFDDIVSHFSSVDTPFWKISEANGMDAYDLVGENSKIGFGAPPDEEANEHIKVDVEGDVRARDTDLPPLGDDYTKGNLLVNEICAADGSGCSSPKIVGGEELNMKCDVGKYVTGIQNGQVVCGNSISFLCPVGQFLAGINPDGTFNCKSQEEAETDGRCPEKEIPPVCEGDDPTILPEAWIGDTAQLTTTRPEADKTFFFECSSTGEWTKISDPILPEGWCSCSSSSSTTPLTCQDLANGVGVPMDQVVMAGSILRHKNSLTCDGQIISSDETYEVAGPDCDCLPGSVQTSVQCTDSGLDGSIVTVTPWQCEDGRTPPQGTYILDNLLSAIFGMGSWATPEVIENCTCQPRAPKQSSVTCPVPDNYQNAGSTGYLDKFNGGGDIVEWQSGTIRYEEYWSCPVVGGTEPGAWSSPPTEVGRDCACKPKIIGPYNWGCPWGMTGIRTKQNEFLCPDGDSQPGVWTGYQDVTNTCVCTAQVYGPYNFSCPAGTRPPLGSPNHNWQQYNVSCDGSGNPQYVDAEGNPTAGPRYYPAPSPPEPYNCIPIVYTWQIPTASTPAGAGTSGAQEGSQCFTFNQISSCYRPLAGGSGEQYSNCVCRE